MKNVSQNEIYVLDTNMLIGFSLWCPMSFNKDFWLKLETALAQGRWILLDVVVSEIKYNNELEKWCKKQKQKGLVKTISNDNRNRAVEINNKYTMIDQFTQKSTVDTYIIAYAEEHNFGICSRESNRISVNDLYKMPDVCALLKIKSIRKPKVFLAKVGF